MAAFDDACIKSDHVEQRAHAQLPPKKRRGDLQFRRSKGRIEAQLGRVIAGLPVDIDRPGKIGRLRVVKPVVVSEPCVRLCQRDDVAGAIMIEIDGPSLVCGVHLCDPRRFPESLDDHVLHKPLVHVNVRDLMIGNGKCLRSAGVEQFSASLDAEREKIHLAKDAIDVDRRSNSGDAVFAENDDARVPFGKVCDQSANLEIDFAQIFRNGRIGRAKALQVVVEVGQVDERQRRIAFAVDDHRGVGDPTRRRDGGGRAPELKKWKRTEPFGEQIPQARRLGPAVGELSPVGGILRARRDGEITARIHREPPAEIRAGETRIKFAERFPERRREHELVALMPEADLGCVAKVPAVADDPVLAWRFARQIGRLSGACHRGRDFANRCKSSARDQGAKIWRGVANQRRREANNVEDGGISHGVRSLAADERG